MTVPWPLLDGDELEEAAAGVLPAGVFDFVAGGAGGEQALEGNRQAFAAHRLLPRVLRGVTEPELATELCGTRLAAPVLVAPMGMQRLVHPSGELGTAAGARAAGAGFITSTGSSHALEDVAAVAPEARWFQLYVLRDRAATADLLRRAEEASYRAVVVTVDVPVAGFRRRDLRNAFDAPPDTVWANLEPYSDDPGGPGRHDRDVARIDPSVTWDDLAWVRERTRLPLVVKGILAAGDARTAVDLGAQGVIVSNHGGRQLGCAPATLDALPAVAEAVAGRAAVLLDGGVRRPDDAVVARAHGADAVAIGRPALWCLALGGEQAVAGWFGRFASELRRTLMLLGRETFAAVCAGDLAPARR